MRIEHVGSASVPGLAAKLIVDVRVSVSDLDEEAAYVPPIEAVGLQLRSRDELHRYFCDPRRCQSSPYGWSYGHGRVIWRQRYCA